MKAVALLISLTLVGCATPPRWLAAHYNSQDPCQNAKTMPNWCGAGGSGRAVIYTTPHQAPLGYESGYVKK